MKIGYICFGVLVVCGLSLSTANAQDMGIFSGQGIRGTESTPEPTKSRWPRLLDFSKKESSAPMAQPFSGLTSNRSEPETDKPRGASFSFPKFEKPSFDWMKKRPSLFKEKEPITPNSGNTNLFTEKETVRTSVFQEMNTKSKDFFGRATGWTQHKNRQMKEKSFETWDAITKDLKNFSESDPDTTTPARPPVRSADATDKPRVRF